MAISGIFTAMWNILKSVVPVGVDPIYFFATFLISFALIYVLLLTLPFFKKEGQTSKGIPFLIALVMAYFVAGSAFVTIIISKLFPNVGLAIMAILGLLLVLAFVFPPAFGKEGEGMPIGPIIAIIAFVIVIYLTYQYAAPELAAQGFISGGLGTNISDEDFALIIVAVIAIAIVFLIVGRKKGPETLGERFLESFRAR